jgi:peptidyl-prolyl cis-trans isomerase C
MKRFLSAAALAAAFPLLVAAQASPAPPTADLPVAVVNGSIITRGYLDFLWSRLPEKVRTQWYQNGGKLGYLEQYVLRRLVIADAVQKGLEQKPQVQDEIAAARDSALFDAYVREVLAPTVITDETMKSYYQENMEAFAVPERAKLRLIAISAAKRSPEEAKALASKILVEVFGGKGEVSSKAELQRRFAEAAERYSEHPSARQGGDLGWASPTAFEGALADAAHTVSPGMMSGVLELQGGYGILFVEERRDAGVLPFEEVRDQVWQKLLAASSKQLVEAAGKRSMELRNAAKVEVLPENLQ